MRTLRFAHFSDSIIILTCLRFARNRAVILVFVLSGMGVCGCASTRVRFAQELQKANPRVVVFDFSFPRGGEASQLLYGNVEAGRVGPAVASRVRRALKATGYFDLVSQRDLYAALLKLGFRDQEEDLSEDKQPAVAKFLGADYAVTGVVQKCRLSYFLQIAESAETSFTATMRDANTWSVMWELNAEKKANYMFPDDLVDELCKEFTRKLVAHAREARWPKRSNAHAPGK